MGQNYFFTQVTLDFRGTTGIDPGPSYVHPLYQWYCIHHTTL